MWEISPLLLLIVVILGLGGLWLVNYLYRREMRLSSLYQIDRMSGIRFEKYLKYLFQSLGYGVQTTPDSNDYGADLVLRKNQEKIVVQAKRYRKNVNNSAVQEVVAAKRHYKCEKSMVITNSYFTANAKNLAKTNDVILWDRDKLRLEVKRMRNKKYVISTRGES